VCPKQVSQALNWGSLTKKEPACRMNLPPSILSILLLITSNVFMTLAWYGHLKNAQSKPWLAAALLS
jgi:hypothetical protein